MRASEAMANATQARKSVQPMLAYRYTTRSLKHFLEGGMRPARVFFAAAHFEFRT